MIFSQGFVHCDPHPGNLLARRMPGGRGAQLVVLDHGMYRNLEEPFRASYSQLWAALLTNDHTRGRAAAAELGVPAADYDVLSLLLTFRPASGALAGQIGARMSHAEREKLRERCVKMPRQAAFAHRICLSPLACGALREPRHFGTCRIPHHPLAIHTLSSQLSPHFLFPSPPFPLPLAAMAMASLARLKSTPSSSGCRAICSL